MLLSIKQADEVELMLREKEELIENREHNKKEVRRLRILEEVATALEYRVLEKSIDVGMRRIQAQTLRIEALTDKKIAEKVGASLDAVRYHSKSSLKHNTPDRQHRIMNEIKRRKTPAYKGALRSVF